MGVEREVAPNEVKHAGAAFRRTVVGLATAFGCEDRWFVQAVVLNDIADGQQLRAGLGPDHGDFGVERMGQISLQILEEEARVSGEFLWRLAAD